MIYNRCNDVDDSMIVDLEYINLRVNVLSGILTAGTFVMYRLLGRSIAARKMSKYEKINKNQDNDEERSY